MGKEKSKPKKTLYWVGVVVAVFGVLLIWNIITRDKREEVSKAGEFGINVPSTQRPLRYGVVFDLGSSGSRAHVFVYERNEYEECRVERGGGIEALEPIALREKGVTGSYKMKPPISSQVASPSSAGASLTPLFEFAYSLIPSSSLSSTPIFAFATAGLRVVAEEEGHAIWDDDDSDDNSIFEEDDDQYGQGSVELILLSIREYIRTSTPFLFHRDDQVRVITGQEEGIFDYLTLQQLMRLNPYSMMGEEASEGREGWSERVMERPIKQWDNAPVYPIATLDLGGASTQISFALSPFSSISPSDPNILLLPPLFHRPSPSQWHLFTHSFLNYGVNRVRELYRDSLYAASPLTSISDPCMPTGTTEQWKVRDKKGKEKLVTFVGAGDYSRCLSALYYLFSFDYLLPCTLSSSSSSSNCAFAQTRIPPIVSSPSLTNNADNQMVIIAFDHAYRIGSLFHFHGYISISEVNQKLVEHLRLSYDEVKQQYPREDEGTWKKMGFELMYLRTLLTVGYSVESNNIKVILSDEVGGYNLNWALGAMLYQTYSLCVRGDL